MKQTGLDLKQLESQLVVKEEQLMQTQENVQKVRLCLSRSTQEYVQKVRVGLSRSA